jgi:thiol:disulfide interchange protein DsbA
MNPSRRKILAATPLAIGLAAAPTLVFGQGTDPKEGTDYKPVSPQLPVENKAKIEVIEFFSYACPHCFAFEPTVEPWIKQLPPVVSFRRVPAIFFETWVPVARLYYALEVLGETERMNKIVFDAIHVEHQRLTTDAAVVDFMEKNGVLRNKFTDAYNSFTVQSKMPHTQQVFAAYNADAVPEFGVDGRYLAPAVLPTVDYLIAQSRKTRKL